VVNSWRGNRELYRIVFPQPLPEGENEKSMAIDEHEIELEMRINWCNFCCRFDLK
jgi:hypothetical protein